MESTFIKRMTKVEFKTGRVDSCGTGCKYDKIFEDTEIQSFQISKKTITFTSGTYFDEMVDYIGVRFLINTYNKDDNYEKKNDYNEIIEKSYVIFKLDDVIIDGDINGVIVKYIFSKIE